MQWMGIDQYLMVMQIADLNSETTNKWRDVENPPGLFQKKKKKSLSLTLDLLASGCLVHLEPKTKMNRFQIFKHNFQMYQYILTNYQKWQSQASPAKSKNIPN